MTAFSTSTSEAPVGQPCSNLQAVQITGCNGPRLVSAPLTLPLDRLEHCTVPANHSSAHVDQADMEMPSHLNDNHQIHNIFSDPSGISSPSPIVLLIHGAWHTPAHYFGLLHALTTTGFSTLCPQLPSCTNVLPPPCSLSDDVSMIRNLALDLADRGHPIIAIMHSYGGVVGTEALAGLGWHLRSKLQASNGQDSHGSVGGVVALIYMTAFMLPVGWSLATPFGGKLPPFMTEHANGTCTMNEEYMRFFSSDVTEEQAKSPNTPSVPSALPCISSSFLVTHLTNHPTAAQTTVITRAAYLDPGMSTTYLICENDKALVPEAQRGIIHMARSNGVEVHEETCKGGHSPFLSIPGDVASVIQRAWIRWADSGQANGTALSNGVNKHDQEPGAKELSFSHSLATLNGAARAVTVKINAAQDDMVEEVRLDETNDVHAVKVSESNVQHAEDIQGNTTNHTQEKEAREIAEQNRDQFLEPITEEVRVHEANSLDAEEVGNISGHHAEAAHGDTTNKPQQDKTEELAQPNRDQLFESRTEDTPATSMITTLLHPEPAAAEASIPEGTIQPPSTLNSIACTTVVSSPSHGANGLIHAAPPLGETIKAETGDHDGRVDHPLIERAREENWA